MEEREQLRDLFRDRRRQIDTRNRKYAETLIITQMLQLPAFVSAQHIAFYGAHDGEVNLEKLQKIAESMHKACYLPRINDEQLHFVRYRSEDPTKKNRHGIIEPSDERSDALIPAEKLDLVLVPLVAYTREGQRLGMGAGYYDKTFAFLTTQEGKKPFLLGIAFELQETDSLEEREWDIPMDAILTETCLIYCLNR